MSTEELLELSTRLYGEADLYRRKLDAAQPDTTREQWDAWDCLRDAAMYLRAAAIKMAVRELRNSPESGWSPDA